MAVYLSCYVLLLIFLFKEAMANRKPDVKFRTGLFIVVMALGLVVGLRDMIGGTDVEWYAYFFEVLVRDKAFEWESMFQLGEEAGYGLYNQFIGLFTYDKYMFFLSTALISYALLYRHIRKYAPYVYFALFILFCRQFLQSFVYIRQFLAMMVLWYAITPIYEKKLIRFLLIILVATSIHVSSVVFLPMYFFARIKWNQLVVAGGMAGCLFLGGTPLMNMIFKSFAAASSSLKADSYVIEGMGLGGNFFYLLEGIALGTGLVISLPKLYSRGAMITCLTNLSIAYVCCSFLSLQNGALVRFIWCFWIALAAVVPLLCEIIQGGRAYFLKFLVILYFTGAWVMYVMRFDDGAFLESYKTFLLK